MTANRKVLIADDDPGIRDLVRTYLDMEGYEVHMAHDGVEALAKVQQIRPHAMILDINMPQMDGFAVLHIMRGMEDATMPVLVLTARHAADDVKRAMNAGARDYLAKPFTRPQLLARMARMLRLPAPQQAYAYI